MKKIDLITFKDKLLDFESSSDDEIYVNPIFSSQVKQIGIKKKIAYQLQNESVTKVQNNINNYFTEHFEINSSAVAYRKKHSYLNFIEPHRSGSFFTRFDIKSFFYNISSETIEKSMSNIFRKEKLNEDQYLIDAFLNLVTYKIPESSSNIRFVGKTVLPIGFITSPMISNIVFRQIDLLIQKLCFEIDVKYTRYADDMLFSHKSNSVVHSDYFLKELKIYLSILNFKINTKKTIYSENCFSLNGYLVDNSINNGEFRITHEKLRPIKKMIYLHQNKKLSADVILKKIFKINVNNIDFGFTVSCDFLEEYSKNQLLNKVSGYRSYLISIFKFYIEYSCTTTEETIKLNNLISKLNNSIDLLAR